MIEAIEIALASAKAATAIIKELEVDAEVKTHIREFSTTIIDLQNSLLDLQSRLYDSEHETEILRGQVRKIQEVNAKKKNFVFRERFYWKNGDDRPFCPNVGKKMKSKFIYLVPESTIKELGIIVKYVKQVITYNSLEGGDLTTYLEVWLWIIQPFQLC